MIHTIHGNALSIFGYGVVITGDSGVGKTELTLSLIDRGHKFISDDHITIRENNLCLIPSRNSFMHISGIGFINVEKTFGADSLGAETKLKMHINLINELLQPSERIYNYLEPLKLLGHNIPSYMLTKRAERPLAILVEILVRQQINLENGYDSHQDFINLSENA